mgnify:CR=1 FL=1
MGEELVRRMGERGVPSSGSALMRNAVIITSVIRPFQKICTTWQARSSKSVASDMSEVACHMRKKHDTYAGSHLRVGNDTRLLRQRVEEGADSVLRSHRVGELGRVPGLGLG